LGDKVEFELESQEERALFIEHGVARVAEFVFLSLLLLLKLYQHAAVLRRIGGHREVLWDALEERVVGDHLAPRAVEPRDLHGDVAEVARAHLVEHLRLDLVAAGAEDLLRDLELLRVSVARAGGAWRARAGGRAGGRAGARTL
jgi:hypothetical protein